ncbi:hypothetical protein LSH36_66g02030 [Paralvinella palmiformis]|uniref:Uncharacterized protein n=1 Tax=Paralvinella palmiformis TaxID=53620 RepID=A0AAD9ND81_9ANNE|nr:hypothetical protein LSH36_66g02030 [Paralvinella palmiformis]
MLHPSMYSVIHSDPEHREIVTFVTQLGHDRFDRLELVLKTWTAAISATVYIPLKDVANFMRKLCKCKMLGNRSNVDIHLVLKDGDYYPLNLLRNVALNATKTPLSYLSDVDFVPANGTERMIEKLWTNNESFFDSNVSTM